MSYFFLYKSKVHQVVKVTLLLLQVSLLLTAASPPPLPVPSPQPSPHMSHTSSTHNHKSSFFVLCARPAFIRRGRRQFSTQPFHSKLGGEVSDTKEPPNCRFEWYMKSARMTITQMHNGPLFSFLSAFDWFTISKSYNIELPAHCVNRHSTAYTEKRRPRRQRRGEYKYHFYSLHFNRWLWSTPIGCESGELYRVPTTWCRILKFLSNNN